MLKNHQSMRDIRRRCTAAKEELSANLHTRLRLVGMESEYYFFQLLVITVPADGPPPLGAGTSWTKCKKK